VPRGVRSYYGVLVDDTDHHGTREPIAFYSRAEYRFCTGVKKRRFCV